MASYWIRDQQGLVLGPVGIDVLKDLAAAKRLGDFTQVSVDGVTWQPPTAFPEVAQAFSPVDSVRTAQEAAQAQRVRAELARFQAMPTHALFGVSASADANIYRQGFLALAKPYHPARLPKDVHPELVRAHIEMFQYLSGRMVEHERSAKAPPPETPRPSPAPSAGLAPAPGVQLLTRPSDGRLEVLIDVDFSNAFMFTEHKLVNFATPGFFVPCQRLAPLGTWLEVHLRFAAPTREIKARGSVVWENLVNASHPKGYGVRLDRLNDDEKAFMRGFVDRYEATKTKRA